MKKIRYRCPNCGSTDLRWNATAKWNEDRQDFELADIHHDEYVMCCGDCGNDIDPIKEEIQ